MIKLLKKNDRLIDIETESEWTFDCKTRGPDVPATAGGKPGVTWTYILKNRNGERRFVPESQLSTNYRRREG